MHISAVRSGNSTGMSYFHLALILTCEKKRENVEENVGHKQIKKILEKLNSDSNILWNLRFN